VPTTVLDEWGTPLRVSRLVKYPSGMRLDEYVIDDHGNGVFIYRKSCWRICGGKTGLVEKQIDGVIEEWGPPIEESLHGKPAVIPMDIDRPTPEDFL
jgi:hypothetical protein